MKRKQDDQQQQRNDQHQFTNTSYNHQNYIPIMYQMNSLQQPYFSLQQFHQQQQFHQYQFLVQQQLLNQHLLQQQHSANPVNISNNSNNNISTNFTLQNSVNTAATTEISTTRGAPNITETPTITPENISTTTRITKEAKTALFLYFNSNNFTVSSKLPRHNSPGHSELDTIISKFNLQRKQAARQLTNWKESKFQIDSNASNLSTENLMV